MPKRFTATEKWVDPWFCSLSNDYKLFWLYLLDNCDHAGFWQVNFPLVNFHIKITSVDMYKFGNRIEVINDELWHITKFNEFQYGKLSNDCKPHQSVIKTLEKHRVSKGYGKGIDTLEDKDKEKDKDNIDSITEKRFSLFWSRYPKKEGKSNSFKRFKTSVSTDKDWQDFQKCVNIYLDKVKKENIEMKFVKQAQTFMTTWKDWLEFSNTTEQKITPQEHNRKLLEKQRLLSLPGTATLDLERMKNAV